jgi:hypothetical protein
MIKDKGEEILRNLKGFGNITAKAFIVFSLFFGIAQTAIADVSYLTNQDTSNRLNLDASVEKFYQRLGTGLSGDITGLQIYLGKPDSGGSAHIEVRLHECTDATYTSCSAGSNAMVWGNYATGAISLTTLPLDATFVSNGQDTLDPTKYYILSYGESGTNGARIYGTETNTYPFGSCSTQKDSDVDCTAENSPNPVYVDIPFNLQGATYTAPDTTTRIVWNSPTATTTSTGITFDFDYYLNSSTHSTTTYTDILLQLYPANYPSDNAQRVTVTSSLIADTLTNVTVNATTTREGYYLGLVNFWNGVEVSTDCNWWEVWCSEEQPIIGAGDSANFTSATSSISSLILPSQEGAISQCEDGTFVESGICKVMVFLFFPSGNIETKLLEFNQTWQNKIPFGYFSQIRTAIDATTATSTSLENYTVTVGTTSPYHLGTLTLINFSSIDSEISDAIETIAQWFIYIFWIIFIIYLLVRIRQFSENL